VKLGLFERHGVLPAAGDRHLVEFFPGFLTEASGWGERWGVHLTTIDDRRNWLRWFRAELDRLRSADLHALPPSGELVAPVIDALERGGRVRLPLNRPNAGQCPDLPAEVVVETMVTADRGTLYAEDAAVAPPVLAEWLRRIVAAQEMTVEAALTGRRDTVVDAMLLDPLAGRIDVEQVEQMTDALLAATRPWLPQFA
jgi:alpha-galactosidase